MPEELSGNILVAQSGGPTTVINASLAGVVTEALNHDCIEEIYGGLNGIEGILNEEFIDLAAESQQTIRGLRHTPASALGTCRFKMKKEADFERVLKVFEAHNIRYFFYIGGNDSQDTADKISKMADKRNYELRVIGIPKTIDNDLVSTDHTPGYGSVVKHICTVIREMCLDHGAMGNHDLVSILEVMGRSAGWIAAGATLAKRRGEPEDPPHIILLPEVAFSPDKFLADIQNVLRKHPYCLIVVGEGLVDEDGNYVSTTTTVTDAFGHSQLGGIADYLMGIVQENLAVKVRSAKLGIPQRAAATHASQTDNDEAFLCGQTAVRAAIEGQTDKMVALIRGDSDTYTAETMLVPLSDVANGVKSLPHAWINEDGISLNYQFVKYATPLIQGEVNVPYENGLPKFVKLTCERIPKMLEPYTVE